MIIQATSGQENFEVGTCKVHLFFSPSNHFPGNEAHIGVVARQGTHGIAMAGFPEVLRAAPGYKDDLGKWTRGTYEVPEGVVLKVFASRSGSRRSMANLYIQMREGAALRRLIIPTTQWAQGQFQEVTVEGRFDTLTLAEATALGVKTPPQYAHFFARTNVDQAMDIRELAPERQARVARTVEVVTNSAGEAVQVPQNRRRRQVQL